MEWTLGILIGLPIAALVTIALVVFALLCHRWREHGLGVGSGAAALVAVGITAFATFPWSAEYHQWRPVSGTVEKVDSRLVSAGDDGRLAQRFVVVIDGQAYGVDDTRAATLKVGDQVALKCKREWQYASEDGYGCRWSR